MRARPGVDPSDPQLAYSVRVTVGEECVELRSSGGGTLLNWGVLKRWEETGGHLFVPGDALAMLFIAEQLRHGLRTCDSRSGGRASPRAERRTSGKNEHSDQSGHQRHVASRSSP